MLLNFNFRQLIGVANDQYKNYYELTEMHRQRYPDSKAGTPGTMQVILYSLCPASAFI